MKLSDLTCKRAKPKEKSYKLSDGAGLYLEVMPNGHKYWRQKYRFDGRERRLAHGVYPEVSLAEAREKRDAARRLLADGQEPGWKQKPENRAVTFEDVAREWHATKRRGWSDGHAQVIMRRLELYLFPRIGCRPIREITPPELLEALREIEGRAIYETTRRCLQYCGQVFRYGIATGRAERDHAADVRDALSPVPVNHMASLDIRELPDFLKTMDRNDARLYPSTKIAMQFLMLTFVRTSEMRCARKEEIDGAERLWIIPAERMKMRKPHLVPLPKQTWEVIQEMSMWNDGSEWLFPSPTRRNQPLSENAVIHGLYRMGYKGRMTGHGFRALAMTAIKEKLHYRHEVIDRQLAHAHRSKVDAAYDRAQFLDERRKMMQDWADYLDTLRSSSSASPE